MAVANARDSWLKDMIQKRGAPEGVEECKLVRWIGVAVDSKINAFPAGPEPLQNELQGNFSPVSFS